MVLDIPAPRPTPPLLSHQIGHEHAHIVAFSCESLRLSGQLLTQQRDLLGTRRLGYGELVLETANLSQTRVLVT